MVLGINSQFREIPLAVAVLREDAQEVLPAPLTVLRVLRAAPLSEEEARDLKELFLWRESVLIKKTQKKKKKRYMRFMIFDYLMLFKIKRKQTDQPISSVSSNV